MTIENVGMIHGDVLYGVKIADEVVFQSTNKFLCESYIKLFKG